VAEGRRERRGEVPGAGLARGDQELTDEELIEICEATIAGVSDGSIPTFGDRKSFVQDALRRLGR